MRRTFVLIFKHFDGSFVLVLRQFLEKLQEKYAVIGIDMDIDTFPITSKIKSNGILVIDTENLAILVK